MRRHADDIVLMLASSDLTDREFAELAAWLSSGGVQEIILAARDTRHRLRRLSQYSSSDSASRSTTSRDTGSSSELSSRVEELLRKGTGLRTDEITALLLKKLGSSVSIPAKTGLKKAVGRLSKIHGDAAVLSAAHQIVADRNRNSHDPDWRLRERD